MSTTPPPLPVASASSVVGASSSNSIPGVSVPAAAEPTLPPAAAAAAKRIRAPIACRRCRRLRTKCVHDDRKAPCKSCREAGLGPESCVFPVRGQPDSDREYRHPRAKAEKIAAKEPKSPKHPSRQLLTANQPLLAEPVKGVDPWDSLPPLPEIIHAVNNFTRHYFQLGFIPKRFFIDRLRRDHRSVSVFLLLSILSISARFTPSLIERHGDGIKAAEFFIDRASAVALSELYQPPNLERCQGFYLLSIAQQGSGWKNSSFINLGIAMRMAALMRLHREETYKLTNPTKELVVAAESARRTLWMLHSQDNLHSGPLSPVSLSTSDITALLPGNEDDFLEGREPKSRAALADTPPAQANPSLMSDSGRSLFASLIHAHYFWGKISRKAVAHDNSSQPWDAQSDYAKMVEQLDSWEKSLPNDHLWSLYNLRRHKAAGLDLAYLAVTMIIRLCNIVLRKAYMHHFIFAERNEVRLTKFWSDMSLGLFHNVAHLFEQIDTQFKEREPDDGPGAQIVAFCVYSCGILAAYLCKYPTACPDGTISRNGPMMLSRTMDILEESQVIWPLASRWREGLEKFTRDKKSRVGHEGSMADGKDAVPHALRQSPSPVSSVGTPSTAPDDKQATSIQEGPQEHNGLPMMHPGPNSYIDSTMRFPGAPPRQPSTTVQPPHLHDPLQQAATQASQPGPHHQHHLTHQVSHGHGAVRGPQSNGINLLLEVLENPSDASVRTNSGVPISPFDNMPATQVAHHHPVTNAAPQEMNFFGQNDGYDHELQFYIEGPGPPPVWGVPQATMYGYGLGDTMGT